MKLPVLALGISLLATSSLATAAPDYAQVEKILKGNACLACHAVDKKVVGPAYQEVARKHEGQDDAADILAKHIREGSSGVYGPVPMPPNPGISDADIKTVVEWLVAGAPH